MPGRLDRPLRRHEGRERRRAVKQSIVHVALVVRDYDEAVAVFEDLYGNLWDLLELTRDQG